MSLWSRLIGRKEERAITSANAGVLLTEDRTWVGMPVTEQSALGISALWCGLHVIGETIGSLPLITYERQADDGRLGATDHPNYRLLLRKPNPAMTRPVFFECLQVHALLYGNAFAEVVRKGDGTASALWPIHPSRVWVYWNTDTDELGYRITELDGTTTFLNAEDVVHVPGLTADGSMGYALLDTARNTIGYGLASQRYSNSLFKNLSRPGGVLEIPPGVNLDDTGRKNLARFFRADTTLENVGSTPLLEQGVKFTPFNMASNEQLQFKELQQFYVYEISRLLRLPPSKLQSLEKASFASLTELNRDFLSTCLSPWLGKWEAELERKLFTDAELDTYYLEFNTDALIRADQNARYTAYQSALSTGWMSVNEVRALEGLSNIGPDGDEFGTSAPDPMPAPQPYPTVNPLADANPTEEPADALSA